VILTGDCLAVMPTLAAASVDAIVTDPPYGLGFMGKAWDRFDRDPVEASWSTKGRNADCVASGKGVSGVGFRNPNPRCGRCGRAINGRDTAKGFKVCSCPSPERIPLPNRDAERFQSYMTEWAAECWRVAKPGAHLVAFGGTRTYHRLTCAIEDAGWEIRDCLMWLYGSGFPKSHNGPWGGTALKPAWEPIVLARKPLAGTVAANVAAHGTGGLNIDGCRIGLIGGTAKANTDATGPSVTAYGHGLNGGVVVPIAAGRWPANVVLGCTCDADRHAIARELAGMVAAARGDADEGWGMWSDWLAVKYGWHKPDCAAGLLDRQAGTLTSGANPTRRGGGSRTTYGEFQGQEECQPARGVDSGGPSRFYYCAKVSRSEREAGLDSLDAVLHGKSNGAKAAAERGEDYDNGDSGLNKTVRVKNHHPTLKPVALMRWLCRLVTPPGGLILDPFTGSGSTGCAAALEGFRFVGIEQSPEYAAIAEARIAHWAGLPADQIALEFDTEAA